MERQARKCCEFAEASGEFVMFHCREMDNRPCSCLCQCSSQSQKLLAISAG